MTLAPIALFVYNRPQHAQQTLETLSQNVLAAESRLYIFCDGPKLDASDEVKKNIEEVRAIARSKRWCKDVIVYERESNQGLFKSITTGVTSLLKENESVIVLEDDHVTSKWFLTFMNQALVDYKHATEVACISGYIYPVTKKLPETFFIKGADCWGWATWRRAWTVFNEDAVFLLNQIKDSGRAGDFNFYNTYPYVQMLEDKIAGRNNSWAILWYASAFLKNMLTLYPGQSLVQNIGNDGTGVHCTPTDAYHVELSTGAVKIEAIPVKENAVAKKIMSEYFLTLYPKRNLTYRIKAKIKKLIGYNQ